MKKTVFFITIFLLSIPIVLADDVNLNVDMPNKVSKGDNFTINIDVNLKNKDILGFECTVKIPIEKVDDIKITGIAGNEELKKEAGKFYEIKKKDSSVSIRFTTFGKPLNSDFHLMTINATALKEGNVTFTFKSIASDENGHRIPVDKKTTDLIIVDNNKTVESDENFLLSIIDAITNFLKSILGG
ncbi:cellulosome anchoring protein cohesin region [Methanothermococcus sp. Ax23]|uniref:cellulosome anchoring protein cohesin region n=1 Tax=Methanothermococcus sp. Ax23 TaxID=3156486 RepID=UPI003BA27D5C